MRNGRRSKLNNWLGLDRHRGVVHGKVIEVRPDGWFGEIVLVNGSKVSWKSALLMAPLHLFTIQDESGHTRNLEVRRVDRVGGLLGTRGYLVAVDGIERGLLDSLNPSPPADRCLHCGYQLVNLPVVNGEVKCPECGRHRAAELLGIDRREAAEPPEQR